MGKARFVYTAPRGARRGPVACIGCKGPIVYGDRCPPCATKLRTRAAKQRRRR